MIAFEFALILGMAAVTFVVRYPVLALVSRMRLAPAVERAMRYIPPAVLAAIITPALFMPEGTLSLRLENSALAAGVVAALLAWRTRNLILTILGGMAIFWVWRLLIAYL